MSLAPKIDEARSTILDYKPNLGFITETWLRDTISRNHLHIPSYSFISRNRTTDIHGGIGLSIVDSIRYRSLDHLQDPEHEVLWAWLRPKRLPRGTPCVITATIYHPFFNDSARDIALLDYLSASLTTVEGEFPGCGILLCGDFNRLKLNRLAAQFGLRQLVSKPTRGDQILDLVFTNQPDLYDINSVQILPPFGLSDHNVVFVHPTTCAPNLNDPPWVTERFKNLIKFRQHAFHNGDMDQYRRYRNDVNRTRKSLRSIYYASKVNNLKNIKPSQWWSAVKRIAGMNPASSSESLLSNPQLGDSFDHLSDVELANAINAVFLESMKHYQLLWLGFR
ncbi:uncharacterized protein LOC111327189 [Stylophora pistillata]|uniref:uncharacterized protein LOC111327189 n=1 Tax=Stylophora pistillata TaxID=50429 RepID=UPI000C041471|nr:uncharacterized protein LOC111327189 [Stylophora pistillata]